MYRPNQYDSLAIVGPTASGKTHKAVALAKAFDGEIISGDSRQVYRDMSIGTGKDLSEYEDVAYHLVDICEAGEKYNLHRYLQDFNRTYKEILIRRKLPIICGGTGLYVENAINGIIMPEVPENPVLRESLKNVPLEELAVRLSKYKTLHNTTDIDTAKRAIRAIEICEYYASHPQEAATASKKSAQKLNCLVIGMDIPREERRNRISRRLKDRLDQGMVEEVRSLLDRGLDPEDLIYYGLEYKYLTLYIIGQLSYDEMVRQLEIAIHQFAKRQMTWFRGMETRGTHIHWLPYDMPDDEWTDEVKAMLENDSVKSLSGTH